MIFSNILVEFEKKAQQNGLSFNPNKIVKIIIKEKGGNYLNMILPRAAMPILA